MAKKYLKGEVNGAKAQQEQVTTEKNVDFQPTNKETKENQTEVRLAQTYKNYKVYGQNLIVKVDKNGVITTVSGKVVQNLDQQPNLTITNFLSKNEVKSKLRDIVQILGDATETELQEKEVYHS
ncbi:MULTISPECIES: bacillolysin [Bacillus]|uniref:Bacillolysin n=1 Tax=Bacillus anthracis TaxID=1392 RepID=A0A2B0WR20_BACAN|nr:MULTISPECIES: bacillolysin [Bacillus cereus group]MBJ8061218.1 bacillolysin [Bacillus cereus]PFL58459.1 bacillolysin [Bacillus anthracis]HDR7435307.1 bacillolysin [Bacillus anthracis]